MLDVSGDIYNPHKFTGGIPSEWGALTNLKELKMAFRGLDGKLLSTRTERLRVLLTFSAFFSRGIAQGAPSFARGSQSEWWYTFVSSPQIHRWNPVRMGRTHESQNAHYDELQPRR